MRMNLNRAWWLPSRMRVRALLAGALLVPAAGQAQPAAEPARIVTLGGSVTETVFALGFGDRVVAVDASSSFPGAVSELPQVGYYRTLSAEGLLSLAPDLVVGAAASGPPEVIALVRRAGVRVELIDDAYTPEQIPENIERIAHALGVPERGRALAEQVRTDFARVRALRSSAGGTLSAVFIWNRAGSGLQVAGGETGAHTMMRVAGLRNGASALAGYQPLNAEAMLMANPDLLIVPASTAQGLGGLDAILDLPGVASTTAARTGNVVVVDLLGFIGFGPRSGRTLADVLEQVQLPTPTPPGGRFARR